jgi:hypothetical protein
MGGLGNQLFQYALGRHLSMIHERPLRFDVSGYTAIKPDAKTGTRMCGLDAFAVSGQAASAEELKHFEIYRRVGTIGRIARLANSWTPYHRRVYLLERRADFWRFCKSVLTSRLASRVYMVGYWQAEKYFADIAGTIQADLRLKRPAEGENAEMLSAIREADSVAVHVRHADNATSAAKGLGILPLAYYEKATGLISQQLRHPQFFVFSDDPDWARATLTLPGPTTFVTHNGDEKNYEDLRLMAACKHHIIANSTFSWWGAWLGKKDGQIVYAPMKYYINTDRDFRDFYPASWNLLPVG